MAYRSSKSRVPVAGGGYGAEKIDRAQMEGGDDSSALEFTPTDEIAESLEGKNGTAEVSWERKPDGRICITAINGHTIGDGASDEDDGGPWKDDGVEQDNPAPEEADNQP